MFKGLSEPLPLKRVGTPDEVVEAYIFVMKVWHNIGIALSDKS